MWPAADHLARQTRTLVVSHSSDLARLFRSLRSRTGLALLGGLAVATAGVQLEQALVFAAGMGLVALSIAYSWAATNRKLQHIRATLDATLKAHDATLNAHDATLKA